MYIPLAGFIDRTVENMTSSTPRLPVAEYTYDYLIAKLEDGDYSYLELRDGRAIEVVKVTNLCGTLVLDRAKEQTKPLAFRCGAGVSFVMTAQSVKDTICQMDKCED